MIFLAIVGIIALIVCYFIAGIVISMFYIDEDNGLYEKIIKAGFGVLVKKDPEHFYISKYGVYEEMWWKRDGYSKLGMTHPFMQKLEATLDISYFLFWPIFLILELANKIINKYKHGTRTSNN